MTGNIIVKPFVRQQFEHFMQQGRVLFFSAPCGFGKTTLADALLRGQNVLRLSADSEGFMLPPADGDWHILLLDNIQYMQEEHDWQLLCELIRSDPGRRFVLLSRGVPPGCLAAFRYTGLMTVLEADDLLFDREDIRRLYQDCGVRITDSGINGILKESTGYPLGVSITARCMSGGKPFDAEIAARVFREVFFILKPPFTIPLIFRCAASCWKWHLLNNSIRRWHEW